MSRLELVAGGTLFFVMAAMLAYASISFAITKVDRFGVLTGWRFWLFLAIYMMSIVLAAFSLLTLVTIIRLAFMRGSAIAASSDAVSPIRYSFYTSGSTAYLPTCARTDAGYHLDIDPVEVASILDTDAFVAALARGIGRGNPEVRTPDRDSFPPPAVLKHTRAASWSSFEETASVWLIEDRNNQLRLVPSRRAPDGGWTSEYSRTHVLPRGASIETICRAVHAVVSHEHS